MPRKLSKPRPSQGAHLAALRSRVGLTQTELATTVGEPQANIAFWERSDKPPRSDVLPKLAKALRVSVEQILTPGSAGVDAQAVRLRRSGPVGRAQKLFNEISRLPRRQQDKVLEVVEALVDTQKRKAS
jgi:transcriptional regulator with XRE-family HTH domain